MAPISTKAFSHLLTVAFLFSLITLPSKSVGFDQRDLSSRTGDHIDGNQRYDQEKTKKMVLGSSPPRCVNKCLNCRPCTATLVIPSHQKKRLVDQTSSRREDDSYYLLSWKCTCGNKLFHP